MSNEMTMDEMIDVLARYQYNAKHDADRIKALEFEVSGLDRLRGRYAEAMNEIARLKAEVERLTNLKSGADYFKAEEGKQS